MCIAPSVQKEHVQNAILRVPRMLAAVSGSIVGFHLTELQQKARIEIEIQSRLAAGSVLMGRTSKQLHKYMLGHNLRWTPQREIILQGVLETNNHFEAEALYHRLRRQGKGVSRATVYRMLPLLQKSGLIREAFRCGSRARYERVARRHDHIVCVLCGKTIEFADRTLQRLREKAAKRHGFKLVEHSVSIRGICKDCDHASRNRKRSYGNET